MTPEEAKNLKIGDTYWYVSATEWYEAFEVGPVTLSISDMTYWQKNRFLTEDEARQELLIRKLQK